MSDKIFITGATGFLGGHLINELLGKDNNLTALVLESEKEKAKALEEKGIRVVYGGLEVTESCIDVLRDTDIVYHLAALMKVEATKEEAYHNNNLGTKALFDACLDTSIRRFMYFSSVGVYGVTGKIPVSEDHPIADSFLNHYEWSKTEAEKLVTKSLKENGLPAVIIRPAIVYGPGSVYGTFIVLKLVAEGKLFVIFDDGQALTHLVHAEDVAGAVTYLAEEGEIGEAYNIADDSIMTVEEAVASISTAAGRKPPKIHVPARIVRPFSRLFGISSQLFEYFIQDHAYDNTKLKKTGYQLRHHRFKDSIKATVAWYRKQGYIK